LHIALLVQNFNATNYVCNVHLHLGEERQERGVNMGHGLQRLTQAHHDKLPVVIPEGMTTPVIPIVAAKFTTKCNIVVRNHILVLKHRSEYKNQPALIDLFLARIHVSTFSFSFPHLVPIKIFVF
jgi:hypothetical protein